MSSLGRFKGSRSARLKFSLIVSSVGRTSEVERFLTFLDTQTYRDFEVLLVDQNSDERLAAIVQRYQGRFALRHLRSQLGVSRGRNVGLRYASGDVIAFPDDDCWYQSPDLLHRVAAMLRCRPDFDGLTGRVVDPGGTPIVLRWFERRCYVSRFNLWRTCTSVTIFLRRNVTEEVGGFDEKLGLGAGTPWSAGEEMDYMLQVLERGFRVRYLPSFEISHPRPVATYDKQHALRSYGSSLGAGRILRTHRYPWWYVLRSWTVALSAFTFALTRGDLAKARTRWACFVGEVRGWFLVVH